MTDLLLEGPRCDFCNGNEPVWIYPAEDFPIGSVITGGFAAFQMSTGGWVACAPCAQHIDLDSYSQLAVRAIANHYTRNPDWDPDDPALEALLRDTHQGFRDHRTGPKAGFG